jgi:hypothetical protein
MARANKYEMIRGQLLELLSPVFPGIEVSVEHSQRFKRMVLTFVHPAFGRWLTEQRFRFVLQRIPPEFFEKHLRGAVWFELAPGETTEDVMKSPRSEDLADQSEAIQKRLEDQGFYGKLQKKMGANPAGTCADDFAQVRAVLEKMGITGKEQTDACLVLIGRGAYCDCAVLGLAEAGA